MVLGLSGSCWRRPLLVLVPVVEDVKDVVEFENLFRELRNSRVHATGACHNECDCFFDAPVPAEGDRRRRAPLRRRLVLAAAALSLRRRNVDPSKGRAARTRKSEINYLTVCIDRGSTKVPVRSAGHAILYGALGIDLVPPATRYEQYIARLEIHARKGNRAVALTACRKLNALIGTDAARFVL